MNGKVIFYLCVLLAVIGVSYSIFYSMEVDEAVRELDLVKPQIQTLENGIESLKAQLEAAKPQIENRHHAKALIAASEILATDKANMRSEIASLEAREADLANQLAQMVKRVRANAVGTVIGDIILPLGRIVKATTVKLVDDDTLTVAHDQGISKIPVDDLPQDLKDRFLLGVVRVQKKEPRPVTAVAEVVIPSVPEKQKADPRPNPNAALRGNRHIEGDPSLWDAVTKTSLGRAYIPGRGWLKIGTKGPITTTGYGQPEHP